jgi:hypothetical protein
MAAMPTVEDPLLVLTTSDEVVTIRVTFHARFTPFERRLAGLGMEYRSHVDVIGIDPPGGTSGTIIVDPAAGFSPFQHVAFAVTEGTVDEILPFDHSVVVDRQLLDEITDGTGEIRCRIQIHADGMPPPLTEPVFTDRRVVRP